MQTESPGIIVSNRYYYGIKTNKKLLKWNKIFRRLGWNGRRTGSSRNRNRDRPPHHQFTARTSKIFFIFYFIGDAIYNITFNVYVMQRGRV